MHSATTSCDVLVVGGGAAGVAAAAAAGRAGARVVLLERYGFLGGTAVAAQVGTVCGLYLRDTTGAEARLIAGGFVKEFALRLQRASGSGPMRLDNGLWVLPFSPPVFARLADAMVYESGKVTVVLHATLAETQVEGPRLTQVRALAWNEPLIIQPGAVVDCSGEATAATLSGVAVENGVADQAPALVFTLDGVDPGLAKRGLLEVRRELYKAIEKGNLPAACERLALVPGASSDGQLVLKLSLSIASPDCPSWQQVTAWEREARMLIDQLQRFLVKNVASCRNARLASVAPQIGIRSGRRIKGRARLADEDVLSARKSPVGIARGCWPMERWGNSPRPEMVYFDERDYYEIPMDCLRTVELDNVLTAGRCISATAKAMTSARVIGTALSTGWAAGTIAAFQTLNRTLDAAVESVREEMNSD